jgi:hypothetical protein
MPRCTCRTTAPYSCYFVPIFARSRGGRYPLSPACYFVRHVLLFTSFRPDLSLAGRVLNHLWWSSVSPLMGHPTLRLSVVDMLTWTHAAIVSDHFKTSTAAYRTCTSGPNVLLRASERSACYTLSPQTVYTAFLIRVLMCLF